MTTAPVTVPALTETQLLTFATAAEGAMSSKELSLVETYVVDVLGIAAFILGAVRPDLRAQISSVPQSVIVGVSILAVLVINVVRTQAKRSVKNAKTAAVSQVVAARAALPVSTAAPLS